MANLTDIEAMIGRSIRRAAFWFALAAVVVLLAREGIRRASDEWSVNGRTGGAFTP